jgi:hypothetical protein
MGETCASCEQDCGPCSVCGNGVCQAPYETCTNCPQDCGECTTQPVDCIEAVMCAFQCFSGGQIMASCVANCLSTACANAQYFVDQVLDCAFENVATCFKGGTGGIATCLMNACPNQIAACIGSQCDTGG